MTAEQQSHLESARRELDGLDDALLLLLAQRAEAVQKLWAWKQAVGLAQRDEAREQAVLDRLVTRGAALGLEPDRLRDVLARIIGSPLRR